MNAPEVSVVMPVFNAAPFIREAVESVLGQTLRNFELIIIDDGSTDESWRIIQSIRDERIHSFQNEKNLGAGKTKNRGIENARGEFIAFLDADDIAMPERLETQAAFLKARSEIDLVATASDVISSDRIVLNCPLREEMDPVRLKTGLLFDNPIIQSSVMLRRASLKGAAFRSEYEPAEDYDLWVRLSQSARMVILAGVLVHYRSHAHGISSRRRGQMRDVVLKIVREQLGRLQLLPSDEQLQMHVDFQSGMTPAMESLPQTETWLKTICEANERHQIYDPIVLEKIIHERWTAFSGAAERIQRGRAPWRRFARGLRNLLLPAKSNVENNV